MMTTTQEEPIETCPAAIATQASQTTSGEADDGQPAKSPPTPQRDESQMRERLKRHAAIVREMVIPSAMATAADLPNYVDAGGMKVYLDGFLRDAECVDDPVLRVMAEQLAFVHHRLAKLHVQASKANGADAVAAYTGAASRLLAELRRLAQAIQTCRGRGKEKPTVVRYEIQQQNVAHGGGKQDVGFRTDAQGERVQLDSHDSEQGGNDDGKPENEDRFGFQGGPDVTIRNDPHANDRLETQESESRSCRAC